MSYPSELISALSSALAVPERTVIQHDRMLVANGVRKVHGRGKSAAQVSPTDAANLLIAVAGSPIAGPAVKATATTFSRYANLTAKRPGLIEAAAWPRSIMILQDLPEGHSFRDALSSLISLWAKPPMSQDVFEIIANDPFNTNGSVDLFVQLHGPRPEASIRIEAEVAQLRPGRNGSDATDFEIDQVGVELVYSAIKPDAPDAEIERQLTEGHKEYPGDLRQVRSFTSFTITELAKLFVNN